MLTRRRGESGITMIEIMVASVLGVLVIYGISTMESSRTGMEDKIRMSTGLVDGEGDAARAMLIIGRDIEKADRVWVNSANPADIQLRMFIPAVACGTGCVGGVPDPCCFDQAGNYRWIQYKLSGAQLRYYANDAGNCTGLKQLGGGIAGAGNITAFTVAFPQNNIVSFAINWDNMLGGTRSRTHNFTDRVTSRAISMGNLNTTGADSGFGLYPAGGGPPASCP